MPEFLHVGILPLVLTLGAYQLGLLCRKVLKTPVANPILISVVIIFCFMKFTGLPVATYQAGMTSITWMLTPATVSLAIPMYEQLKVLKKNFPAILAGVVSGAVSCLIMILGFAALFGFDRELTVSLLPKSVTNAIGVPLSQMSGGIASITTVAILVTGILASIIGTACCRLFRLTNPVAQGVAFGTAGHVIGTAKATELSAVTGATSSLALVVAGILTAVIFPLLAGLL